MRIEHEMKEAEEQARIEAEAEAAALTEILNLDNVLVCDVCQWSLSLSTFSLFEYQYDCSVRVHVIRVALELLKHQLLTQFLEN